MPALKDIELSEEQSEELEQLDISEDEVSDCISEKIDEGMDQDQAIAACLDMAESGSSEPEQNSMNPEEREERKQEVIDHQEEIKTAQLKVTGKDVEVAQKNSDGEIMVNVPIQSLSEDRDGDIINEKGQESIIRQLKSGTVPLFFNHGIGSHAALYDGRDIIGQFVDGEKRNGTTIGTARLLFKDADTREELVDDADKLVNLLKQDMPIGFSVGFIPQDKTPREDREEGFEISDLDLMEVSAVGIPSNPDAVPQAMGTAVQMAKNAGLNKNQIMENIEKSLNDTMSEEPNEKDGNTTESPDNEGDTKKPEEQSDKQFSDDEIQEILGVLGGAISAHMDEAMQQIEAELQGEEDGEDTEEDEMDDEEEEEDTVETDNEETEEDGAETDSEEVEEEKETGQEEEGLTDEEKTSEESDSGRKMNTLEEESEEEESETEKSEEENDPAKVEQPSAYWG